MKRQGERLKPKRRIWLSIFLWTFAPIGLLFVLLVIYTLCIEPYFGADNLERTIVKLDTESLESKHCTIWWNPDNGQLESIYASLLSEHCEAAYAQICSDLGLDPGKGKRINVYSYGDDLRDAIYYEGPSTDWTSPEGSGSHFIACDIEGSGATHEIIHSLLARARDEKLLPSNSDYNREHLLVSYYAYWIDGKLCPSEMYDPWVGRFYPDVFADKTNKDMSESALRREWTLAGLSVTGGGAAFGVAFHYLVHEHNGPDIFAKLFAHTGDENYPWSVLGTTPDEFISGLEKWAAAEPPSLLEKIQEYYTKGKKLRYSDVKEIATRDQPDCDKLTTIHSTALTLKFRPQDYPGISKKNAAALLNRDIPDMIRSLAKSDPRRDKDDWEHFIAFIKTPLPDGDYSPDTEFGKAALEASNFTTVRNYINIIPDARPLYLALLKKSLVDQPLNLDNLEEYFSICPASEKKEIAQRIKSHPALAASHSLARKTYAKFQLSKY